MQKRFYYRNKLNLVMGLYCLLLFLINHFKPAIVYDTDGSFRHFGIGSKNKTLFPIWIVVYLSAVFAYLAVLYFLRHL